MHRNDFAGGGTLWHMRPFPRHAASEFTVFKRLTTPQKIQDFLDAFPFNFEEHGDTMRSPRATLGGKTAHCLEGALLAAAALWYHGHPPLLLDLETTPGEKDQSHVVALFKKDGRWGAISKTNHAVLRYRDPVFTTVRELALSYFNEYFLDSGVKTLRKFSRPFDLSRLSSKWLTCEKPLWHIERALVRTRHEQIAPQRALRALRPADAIEIKAGKIVAYKKSRSKIRTGGRGRM
jgi:hypothetical protein